MVFNKERFICQIQHQNSLDFCASIEMMRGDVNDVICPKPRQVEIFNCPSRASHFHNVNNSQIETYDVKAGNELLDLILSKDAYGGKKPNFQVALSPPFYNGSPPTRASNPVIQDEQFSTTKLNDNPSMFDLLASPASRLSRGGGCVHVKNYTPEKRIEGFSSRNNCNVSAIV